MGKLIRKRNTVYDAFQVKEDTVIFEITDWLKEFAPNSVFHNWGNLKVGTYILACEGTIAGTFSPDIIELEFLNAEGLFGGK